MKAYVENEKITKVEGLPNHVASNGGLCPRGLSAVEYEYDPKRLKNPLKRDGKRGQGRWRKIPWDEAMNIIATKLLKVKEEYGAESVVWHRGAAPGWGSNWSYVQRFMNAFGSPNVASHDHLCYTPRTIGHMYTYGDQLLPDYENAKLIVLWGFNPIETSLTNHGRRILDAVERGARLIVVDPRFTAVASKANLFVQPRPGTDGALALGMLNYIIEEELYDKKFVDQWVHGFDEFKAFVDRYSLRRVSEITWVPVDKIREAAHLYATNSPGAVLEDGNGIEQHTNVVQTTRAIAILRAITGNIDVPGGNVFPLPLNSRDLTLSEKLDENLGNGIKSVSTHPLYYPLWGVSTPEVLDAIDARKPYSLKALIVQGSSLVTVVSNSPRVGEKLKRLDFIVVHDLYLTATAELADIVLPAASFFEYAHIRTGGYCSPRIDTCIVTLADKVVEPLGECRSDPKFIFELARRVGLEEYFPWKSDEEAINYELEPLGLTVEELRKHPEGTTITFSPQEVYRKYEKNRFQTSTGKVEFYSETFKKHGYNPLPEFKEPAESPYSKPALFRKYPLVCGTGIKLGRFTHTQFRTLPSLNRIHPNPFVEINPHTARKLGIKDQDWVFVESRRGRIRVKAKLTFAVHPKVVMVAHGWGQPYAHGQPDNILTDDTERCPISAATGNRSFLCKVYKESD
jgi:anaerobic selenocysteine-containing dehydrogenase